MENEELEKYKITLDFLKYEGTMVWQISGAFLIAHTIFIGFVATTFVDNKTHDAKYFLFLSAVGLLLATLWLLSFNANSKWYYFRMEQAKRDETKFKEFIGDNNWFLLTGGAEKFSEKPYIKRANKIAGFGMIILFMILYLTIFIWSICK